MELLTLAQAAALIFTGFATALAALVFMTGRRRTGVAAQPVTTAPEIAFLFDGETLLDASDAGRRLLDMTPARGSDIMRLVTFLAPRFPDLHDQVMASGELDALDMVSSDGSSRLLVDVAAGRVRLTLEDYDSDPGAQPDRHSFHALTDELANYRALDHGGPVPAWRQTEDGKIIWANAAYLALAAQTRQGENRSGLTPMLFGLGNLAVHLDGGMQRRQLNLTPDAPPQWYDCQVQPLGADYLITALPVDSAVRAERDLQDFVQALTQTFAHLSVGLAIFDRTRRLTLFNPALTDLLTLPPEFLITHPPLFRFLDKLRERQMIPEPKNYRSWRQQMSELEAAAADGSYSETWTLGDGRTYQVTGRPHPNGAVAFLFEDISAEISLTRRFRAELETGQAVIDSLDEAIAVFSPAGFLIMSNRIYADLWDCDPSTSLGQVTFHDATRRWQQFCNPSPVWGNARDFAATIGVRSNWTAEVRLRDGRRLCCRFEALPGGATLAAFAEPTGTVYAPVPDALEPVTA